MEANSQILIQDGSEDIRSITQLDLELRFVEPVDTIPFLSGTSSSLIKWIGVCVDCDFNNDRDNPLDADSFSFGDSAYDLGLSLGWSDDNSTMDLFGSGSYDDPIATSSLSTSGIEDNEMDSSPFFRGEDVQSQFNANTAAPPAPFTTLPKLPPLPPLQISRNNPSAVASTFSRQSRAVHREDTSDKVKPNQPRLFVHAIQVSGSGMIPVRDPGHTIRMNYKSFAFTIRSFAENVDHELLSWLNSEQISTIDKDPKYQSRSSNTELGKPIKVTIKWPDIDYLVLDRQRISDSQTLQPAMLSFKLHDPKDPNFVAFFTRMRTVCPDLERPSSQNIHINVLLKYEETKWKYFEEKNNSRKNFKILK
ncbi:hypothetical protein BLNAU_8337 [Blattamonas nauphoetae]|uniref:Uncharacterized protein n=1 Tax=Blattamonas nauphoetae TaxID=2049346 RepID=A0ABQ9XYX7_9EUKA|nr:hypothetical protein BLNAU_8337 [Blattamonas nauphoetae]